MSCHCGNTTRLVCMLILVAAYFLVELIVGYAIRSISLVADAFHMLSDFLALVIGLIATRIAKWPRSSKNTFGWQRAEVMGGLINSVILITLCGTILLQAIQRFIETEPIENPRLMIYVGVGGMLINVIGLLVLGVHSHDNHEKTIPVTVGEIFEPPPIDMPARVNHDGDLYSMNPTRNGALIPVHKNNSGTSYPDASSIEDGLMSPNHVGVPVTSVEQPKKAKGGKSLNMRAVFLHVLADFLGSIIVVTSALLLEFAPGDVAAEGSWKLYVDPAMSVLMVIIILATAVPLAYKVVLILLQSVPSEISLKNLKERLETIEGIHKIHDLHVWRLQSNCIIGTVHIRCASLPDYLNIARQVKELFHDFDIHCTTIQPEFEEYSEHEPEREIDYQTCVLDCGPNKTCQSDTCCPADTQSKSSAPSIEESLSSYRPSQLAMDRSAINGGEPSVLPVVPEETDSNNAQLTSV